MTAPPLDGEKVTTHFNQKPTKNLATKKRKEKYSQLAKVMFVGIEEETNTAGRKAGARAVWNDEEQAADILAG